MDKNTRINMISDAIKKVAGADLGAFCDIKEKDGKLMIVVENSGDSNSVVVTIQGELGESQIQKAAEIIKSFGGDELQLTATLSLDKAVELVEKALVELTGNENVDIDVELVLE